MLFRSTMTSKTQLSGNLCNTEKDAVNTSVTFYDSLGNPYTLQLKLTREKTTDADGKESVVPNKWNIEAADEITDPKGNKVAVTVDLSVKELEFNENGSLKTPGDKAFTIGFGGTGGTTSLTGTGSTISDINVDISGLTQYANDTNIDPKTLNGNMAGTLSGYSIGNDGIITATYDNGDRRPIAQVVVAEFDNPAGLEKVGDNLYTSTTNSGDFDGIDRKSVV